MGYSKIDLLTRLAKTSIWDLGQQVPCAYPMLDPKILLKFGRWIEEVPKISHNFQNML